MVAFYPPPDCRDLLPPLLASIPTAYISRRPPPALLPLLSPILRQRVQHLTDTATSFSESWLKLLCWESEPGQRLAELVADSDAFELHPVSGEIDFGDVEEIGYKRLDEETLQARVVLPDIGIVVIYLWCEGDREGGGDGWRVSEVTPLEGEAETSSHNWSASVGEADEKSKGRMMEEAIRQGQDNLVAKGEDIGVDDEDDGDYWAQYDRTPAGVTEKSSNPAPKPTASATEADYFGQYAQVQPAMDNDDPSADRNTFGETSLNGDTVTSSTTQPLGNGLTVSDTNHALPNGVGVQPAITEPFQAANNGIVHPDPYSLPTPSASIPQLQALAEAQDETSSHITASITALWALSHKSGVSKRDFGRIVRAQLDALDTEEEG